MGKMQPSAVISVFILNPGFDVPSYQAPCLPLRNSHVLATRVASRTVAAKYLRASLTVTNTNVGWPISRGTETPNNGKDAILSCQLRRSTSLPLFLCSDSRFSCEFCFTAAVSGCTSACMCMYCVLTAWSRNSGHRHLMIQRADDINTTFFH
jgi:hypothetical protein